MIDSIRPNKVLITEDKIGEIRSEAMLYGRRGLETGGIMVGKVLPNRVYAVTDLIDAGPNARRTPASFSPDNQYAMQAMREIKGKDPEKRYLGEWHIHPWEGKPYPSGIDLGQLQESKSKRPWYVIMLNTLNGYKFWDLNNEGDDFVEVRSTVLPQTVSQDSILDRIREITQDDVLSDKKVTIMGLGSLGSVIAKYLGCTGIGEFHLVDNEELEVVNVIRHEGTIHDIGKAKTTICREVIESHNPFAAVEEFKIDVLSNRAETANLVTTSNLVVSCSGNPKVNQAVNSICVEQGIPAVYAAIFARASGGFSLACRPNGACFNCLFDTVSGTHYVDRQQALDYGFDVEELHQQQGLWVDVSLTALCATKHALTILQNESMPYNLVRVHSSLDVKKVHLAKKENCAACNHEGWLTEQERMLDSQANSESAHPQSNSMLFGNLKNWLRRRAS